MPRAGVWVGVWVHLSHSVFSKLLGAPATPVPLSVDTGCVFAGQSVALHFHWVGAGNHTVLWNSSSICTNELMGLVPKATRPRPVHARHA